MSNGDRIIPGSWCLQVARSIRWIIPQTECWFLFKLLFTLILMPNIWSKHIANFSIIIRHSFGLYSVECLLSRTSIYTTCCVPTPVPNHCIRIAFLKWIPHILLQHVYILKPSSKDYTCDNVSNCQFLFTGTKSESTEGEKIVTVFKHHEVPGISHFLHFELFNVNICCFNPLQRFALSQLFLDGHAKVDFKASLLLGFLQTLEVSLDAWKWVTDSVWFPPQIKNQQTENIWHRLIWV